MSLFRSLLSQTGEQTEGFLTFADPDTLEFRRNYERNLQSSNNGLSEGGIYAYGFDNSTRYILADKSLKSLYNSEYQIKFYSSNSNNSVSYMLGKVPGMFSLRKYNGTLYFRDSQGAERFNVGTLGSQYLKWQVNGAGVVLNGRQYNRDSVKDFQKYDAIAYAYTYNNEETVYLIGNYVYDSNLDLLDPQPLVKKIEPGWVLEKSNKVGSIQISEYGVASGFSDSNCIVCTRSIDTSKDLEIIVKVKTPNFQADSYRAIMAYGSRLYIGLSNENKIYVNMGNGDYLAGGLIGTEVLSYDTSYYIKVTRSGNTINCYHRPRLDTAWISDGSFTTSYTSVFTPNIGGYNGTQSPSEYWYGEIDLSECSITNDGITTTFGYRETRSGVELLSDWSLDNATVIGTLSKYKGVYSDFSKSNYIRVDRNITSAPSTFESLIKFTTPLAWNTSVDSETLGFNSEDYKGIMIYITTHSGSGYSAGKIDIVLGRGGQTWENIVNQNYTLSLDTTYWVKITWDGTTWRTLISTDGESFDSIGMIDTTFPVLPSLWSIGCSLNSWSGNNPFKGSIDLEDTYLKFDNDKITFGSINIITIPEGFYTRNSELDTTDRTDVSKPGYIEKDFYGFTNKDEESIWSNDIPIYDEGGHLASFITNQSATNYGDGEWGNFGNGRYLLMTNPASTTSANLNTWEMVFKVRSPSTTGDMYSYRIINDRNSYDNFVFGANARYFYFYSNAYGELRLASNVLSNTIYYVKVSYDKSQGRITGSYSLDGQEWIESSSGSTTSFSFTYSQFSIGNRQYENSVCTWYGTIFMNESYLMVNGNKYKFGIAEATKFYDGEGDLLDPQPTIGTYVTSNTVTVYKSSNGTTWTQIGQYTDDNININNTDPIMIGSDETNNAWNHFIYPTELKISIDGVEKLNGNTCGIYKQSEDIPEGETNYLLDPTGRIYGSPYMLRNFTNRFNFIRAKVKQPTRSLDLIVKVRTPMSMSNYSLTEVEKETYGIILRLQSDGLHVWMGDKDFYSWNIANSFMPGITVEYAMDTWFRVQWDGTTYRFGYSYDGETYTWGANTITSSTPVYFADDIMTLGGTWWEDYAFLNEGAIFPEASYLSVDNEVVWRGITYKLEKGSGVAVNEGMATSTYKYTSYDSSTYKKGDFTKNNSIKSIQTDAAGDTVYEVEEFTEDTKTVTIQAGPTYKDYQTQDGTKDYYLGYRTPIVTTGDMRYDSYNGVIHGKDCTVGFASGNYIQTVDQFNPEGNTWEIVIPVVINSNGDHRIICSVNDNRFHSGINSNGYAWYYVGNGSSWIHYLESTYLHEVGKKVYYKFYYDGTNYGIEHSFDGVTYIQSCTPIESTQLVPSDKLNFGSWSSYYLRGGIYFPETYIKIGNDIWFDGEESSPSSCLTFSGFSNSNYITINHNYIDTNSTQIWNFISIPDITFSGLSEIVCTNYYELFFYFDYGSRVLCTYNESTAQTVQLWTLDNNKEYFVKVIIDGNYRKYYLSEDGEVFSNEIIVTDTSVVRDNSSVYISNRPNLDRYYLGSINMKGIKFYKGDTLVFNGETNEAYSIVGTLTRSNGVLNKVNTYTLTNDKQYSMSVGTGYVTTKKIIDLASADNWELVISYTKTSAINSTRYLLSNTKPDSDYYYYGPRIYHNSSNRLYMSLYDQNGNYMNNSYFSYSLNINTTYEFKFACIKSGSTYNYTGQVRPVGGNWSTVSSMSSEYKIRNNYQWVFLNRYYNNTGSVNSNGFIDFDKSYVVIDGVKAYFGKSEITTQFLDSNFDPIPGLDCQYNDENQIVIDGDIVEYNPDGDICVLQDIVKANYIGSDPNLTPTIKSDIDSTIKTDTQVSISQTSSIPDGYVTFDMDFIPDAETYLWIGNERYTKEQLPAIVKKNTNIVIKSYKDGELIYNKAFHFDKNQYMYLRTLSVIPTVDEMNYKFEINNVDVKSQKVTGSKIYNNLSYKLNNYIELPSTLASTNNSELLVSFTTTSPNSQQSVIHRQGLYCIDIWNSNISCYSWKDDTTYIIASYIQANTKYWIKITANGNDRTYYLSLDGKTWMKKVELTDIYDSVGPIHLCDDENNQTRVLLGNLYMSDLRISHDGTEVFNGATAIEGQDYSLMGDYWADADSNEAVTSKYLGFNNDTDNYLHLNKEFNPGNNPWEIQVGVILSNTRYDYQPIFASTDSSSYQRLALFLDSSGRVHLLARNSSNNGYIIEATGNKIYDIKRYYLFRIKFTGSNYYVDYSINNGSTWTTDINISTSDTIQPFSIRFGSNYIYGIWYYNNNLSIKLSSIKMKINGEWFIGNEPLVRNTNYWLNGGVYIYPSIKNFSDYEYVYAYHGDSIIYELSKEHNITYKGSYTIPYKGIYVRNVNITVTPLYGIEIIPDVEGTTITQTARNSGVTTLGSYAEYQRGTTVDWEVSKAGYETQKGTVITGEEE